MKNQTVFQLLTIVLFILLIGVTSYRMFHQVRTGQDQIISREVVQLVEIMKRIDKKCKIIDFDFQKNPINFLTVVAFKSSEVGSMNLTYPDQWEGPYMKDNPTIQKKEYQIVETKKGYFITPGDGVRLGNGKIVGKDIILDEDADIAAMMQDENVFLFKGRALAAPLSVGSSAVHEVLLENIVRMDNGLVMLHDNKNSRLAMR